MVCIAAWVDIGLVDSTLELLRVLGLDEGFSAAPSQWAAVKTAWMSFCEAQLDRRERIASKQSSQREWELPSSMLAISLGEEPEELSSAMMDAEMHGNADGETLRGELEGGVYGFGMRLLLHATAEQSIAQLRWERYMSRLAHLMHAVQPPLVQPGKRADLAKRRQRLQGVCGRWQAAQLESYSHTLLPKEHSAKSQQPAPAQGLLLLVLARLSSMMGGRSTDAENSSLHALIMTGIQLLEPHPWHDARGAAPAEVQSAELEKCAGLFRQVLLHALDERTAATRDSLTAMSRQIAKLLVAQRVQKWRHARELDHGTERWQERTKLPHGFFDALTFPALTLHTYERMLTWLFLPS